MTNRLALGDVDAAVNGTQQKAWGLLLEQSKGERKMDAPEYIQVLRLVRMIERGLSAGDSKSAINSACKHREPQDREWVDDLPIGLAGGVQGDECSPEDTG